MSKGAVSLDSRLRALRPQDLERIIAIDQAHTGISRRGFIEKRLAATQARPEDFIFIGIERDGILLGFALGRVLCGEFGQTEPTAVLDAIGVDSAQQHHGYGHSLMGGVLAAIRERGVSKLHSQAEWTSHGLLKFFDSIGFTLAPRVVLERSTSSALAENGADI
jgi:N-acetylglutamate synthase-like GNAT family acetyltransferase